LFEVGKAAVDLEGTGTAEEAHCMEACTVGSIGAVLEAHLQKAATVEVEMVVENHREGDLAASEETQKPHGTAGQQCLLKRLKAYQARLETCVLLLD